MTWFLSKFKTELLMASAVLAIFFGIYRAGEKSARRRVENNFHKKVLKNVQKKDKVHRAAQRSSYDDNIEWLRKHRPTSSK